MDLIGWNSGPSIRLYVRPSVHKKFCSFLIWYVGRPRPHICTPVWLRPDPRSRSRSMSFWSLENCTSLGLFPLPFWRGSDYNSMGPILQRVAAWFLNFLLSKLSCDFRLSGMSILQDFQRAIFLYCLRLESHGRVCCKSYMYCVCWCDLDAIQGQGHMAVTIITLPGPLYNISILCYAVVDI